MKKTIRVLALVLCCALAAATVAYAAGTYTTKNLTAYYWGIKLNINGSAVVPKDANGKVVDPFIVDGTTYLPVRAVSQALGKAVSWNDDTKTVTITNPHQQYWGAYFLQAEQARGTTRVTSDSVAKRYAQEVIRMTRNDNKVSYQGKATKNGQSVWMFRYDYTYRGSSYYDEFYVTPGGNIYYRSGGSGSYTKWW